MLYEIFKFELKYRMKRPETFLFFLFLLVFSVFAVDFIFEGVELGLVKKNAPIVIGKTMGAMTGIFMILTSMIMGMPIIRDDQYQITPLMYTLPIKKSDLLLGRFLGSFFILVILFCGIPIGMMLGELLPWHLESEMLPFNFTSYLNVFFCIVLPSLFFGAALFFVTGTLSRNLLVVYTQGIFLFVLFLLTKAITNEYLQAVVDPFSLTTITQLSKDWSVAEKNTLLLPFSGVLLFNKIFWIGLGVLVMGIGYTKFSFSKITDARKYIKPKGEEESTDVPHNLSLPNAILQYGWQSQGKQFFLLSLFYSKSLLKEASFWAIIICAVIIIIINSINLGTVYGVDSYPTTYLIIEELQELSLYFFLIIMLLYSGELYWQERGVQMQLMRDATPISLLISLSSKMAALLMIYVVIMCFLIVSGLSFQWIKGYPHFDLPVYFSGFFLEILPFLAIYTFAAFFIQSLVNNKFVGILFSLIFFIVTSAMEPLGFDHVLFNFGGGGLQSYSEMNGYGHFMPSYLWTKFYWILFGVLMMMFASLISNRGIDVGLLQRWKGAQSNLSKKMQLFGSVVLSIFILTGAYIFFQTNILNEVWTAKEKQSYRANYEKTLQPFQYIPQPNIIAANLFIELYPEKRAYELEGEYILKNEAGIPIKEIPIQKRIEADITLDSLHFSVPATLDNQYQAFGYSIYQLATPLAIGDSITMYFKQALQPKGFNDKGNSSSVLYNGTFIRNNEFPTIGYNNKYELRETSERDHYGLALRPVKAAIDDMQELQVSRSGSDSHGLRTNIIIGIHPDQTAITSGKLLRKWKQGNRNYFEYQTKKPIINFYSILSGRYASLRDKWYPNPQSEQAAVDLEIYYHPRHTYNLDRMMDGMKASLDYYTTHFSPYQYQQLRIVEFPRYEQFAQAFPNTISFSESIGFMLDIDDATDIDMTFFVTAHEVAHQWWGMQVEAANVKGSNFVLETLSQYSALMVFKKQFAQTKVDQFLTLQRELYEKGRNKSKVAEVPLYLVENEEYLYYNKGAIVMYQLQELIGEEKINDALRSFIKDWNSVDGQIKCKTTRYATSEDLISYILGVTAEEQKKVVRKLLKEL